MERISYLLTHGFQIWPYMSLLLIYSTVFLTPKPYRKYLLYAVIALVIFFGGFKDIMSPDFVRYKIMFENYQRLHLSTIEPLYILISWILNQLNMSFYALSFIYFFLTIIFLVTSLKNFTNYVEYAFFIWLTIPGFFLNTFVEMRQMLAVAFFVSAISLWIKEPKGRLLYPVILFILSALTHYSSVFATFLFFATYKIAKRKYSLAFYTIMLFLGFVIGISGIAVQLMKVIEPVIPQKYMPYLFGSKADYLKLSVYLFYALVIVILNRYIDTNHMKKPNRSNPILLNLFIIGVFVLLISPSSEISREAYYFLILQTALVPNLLHTLKTKYPEEKILLIYIFTMFFVTQYIYGLFFVPKEIGRFVYIPYKNVFLGTFE